MSACSYRSACPISMCLRVQACFVTWLLSGTFIEKKPNRSPTTIWLKNKYIQEKLHIKISPCFICHSFQNHFSRILFIPAQDSSYAYVLSSISLTRTQNDFVYIPSAGCSSHSFPPCISITFLETLKPSPLPP